MLITAGCGISQESWQRWPTWPKYCSMVADHVNIGIPAAGNELISRAVRKQIQESEPACVIVAWTEYRKIDLFVDNESLAKEIRNYPSRNFLVDWKGQITDRGIGWWPSSVSNDNPIKQRISEYDSEKYRAMITLESIISLQDACEKKKIPLYQFLGYELPINSWMRDRDLKWLCDQIAWENIDTSALEDDYYSGPWRRYQIGDDYGLIPTAGWHAEFFRDRIMPIVRRHCTIRDIKLDKLVEAATILTEKIWHEDSNSIAKD